MTDKTKDLLAMAEKSLADFLTHHEKNYYPSEVVFSRARQSLDAIRASATSAPVQPLTDEQIEAIAKPFISAVGDHWANQDAICDNGAVLEFARAIESAVRGNAQGSAK